MSNDHKLTKRNVRGLFNTMERSISKMAKYYLKSNGYEIRDNLDNYSNKSCIDMNRIAEKSCQGLSTEV